ncbi:uncharacterized protein MAM_07531 [Metarhizium album ARSEF 1941]|uniref:Uncharacterized protein n=1 Tax=Metarhizium album (strain ARSEF 1941) TaxID=1081103 RepID=A0A0B2WNP4_METAS|nr:uncharacterized protein MAM_07531 [Metarhizium album ARSEF 1941]KHN94625.1 hypothetical protein MAM_07531 [Metarhizium album ARSEF 1941]
MDEPSSAVHAIIHILKSTWSLDWTRPLSYMTAGLTLPLRLAFIPLSYVLAVLAVLLAPAGHILAYLGSWVAAMAALLVSLEPLYTFFSVAAFIGIVAGLLMAVVSAILTSHFNMQDEHDDASRRLQQQQRQQQMQREALSHEKQMYLQQQYLRREPHGLEPDWHWGDPSQPQSRIRRASGLQAEIILEEDDSDE